MSKPTDRMYSSALLSRMKWQTMRRRAAQWQNQRRIINLAHQVAAHQPPPKQQAPVVFFVASARLTSFTLNAAYTLLTSWSLRLSGVPVKHFVCQAGMSQCVLGTNSADLNQPPPCQKCVALSKRLYTETDVTWFSYHDDSDLQAELSELTVEQLSRFEFSPVSIPLGKLVLPSVRWALRRHNLPDDLPTRALLRRYILSAYNIVRQFTAFLDREKPQLAVIFNGALYPEAAARWVVYQRGLRSVAFEVGFQPFSVFFTDGEPTAYPVHIPETFELSPAQNSLLDGLLEKRFQGEFTMAGIRFWPEMRRLGNDLLDKMAGFRQVVPVFTNVVYDTSQVHANTIFDNMFEWLDLILVITRNHPETLFVIRAHPDEKRPVSNKISNESVHDWVYRNQVHLLPNVVFIEPDEFLSSYELIQRSKFVLVYNSSIGLEATLLGVPVICGGKARYTQYPTVYLPESASALRSTIEKFLDADEISDIFTGDVKAKFQRNARRFLYYQFYQISLPLSDYLQEGEKQGFVYLKPISWRELLPENSSVLRIIYNGMMQQQPFLLSESESVAIE